jgi:hypothetical protein
MHTVEVVSHARKDGAGTPPRECILSYMSSDDHIRGWSGVATKTPSSRETYSRHHASDIWIAVAPLNRVVMEVVEHARPAGMAESTAATPRRDEYGGEEVHAPSFTRSHLS